MQFVGRQRDIISERTMKRKGIVWHAINVGMLTSEAWHALNGGMLTSEGRWRLLWLIRDLWKSIWIFWDISLIYPYSLSLVSLYSKSSLQSVLKVKLLLICPYILGHFSIYRFSGCPHANWWKYPYMRNPNLTWFIYKINLKNNELLHGVKIPPLFSLFNFF